MAEGQWAVSAVIEFRDRLNFVQQARLRARFEGIRQTGAMDGDRILRITMRVSGQSAEETWQFVELVLDAKVGDSGFERHEWKARLTKAELVRDDDA